MKNILVIGLLLFSSSVLANSKHANSISSKIHNRVIDKHIVKQQRSTLSFDKSQSTKYDHLFIKWGNKYSPNVNSKLMKAVCTIESNLNPNAVSPENALGLCQITKPTWYGIIKNLKHIPKNGYFNPSHSIEASSYYLTTFSEYFNDLNGRNKIQMMLMSYNAGYGNVLKAKQRCKSNSYDKIKSCLKSITGQNSKQTINYVSDVLAYYDAM